MKTKASLFLFALLIVLCTFIGTALAQSDGDVIVHSEGLGTEMSTVEPEEVAPCPVYGIHRMKSQGFAWVVDYYTGEVIFRDGWYECTCGERFACTGYPHFGWPIYHYITEGAIITWEGWESLRTFYVDPDLVYYTEDSIIPGYRFYSA